MTISALWGWADLPPPPHQMLKDTHWEQLDTFLHTGPHGAGWGRVTAQWTPKFTPDFAHCPNTVKTQLSAELRVEGVSFLGGMGALGRAMFSGHRQPGAPGWNVRVCAY